MSSIKKLASTTDTDKYNAVIVSDKKKLEAEEKKLARANKLGNVEWLKQCLVSENARETYFTLTRCADHRRIYSASNLQETMTNPSNARHYDCI